MSFKQFVTEQEKEKVQDKEEQVMGSIVEFFSSHEKPSDADIHKLAEDLGIDEHKFKEKIYQILSSFWNAGRYKENPVEPDPEELKKGIEVEMEHTTNKALAKRIALDHLSEMKDYYTKLAKMESKK